MKILKEEVSVKDFWIEVLIHILINGFTLGLCLFLIWITAKMFVN